jgi:hypothetical protein
MAFRRISLARYQAEKVVGSGETQQHAYNTDALHARPRCLYVGPHPRPEASVFGTSENAPSGWNEKFRRTSGYIGVGGGDEWTMDVSSILPASPDSSIRILANWIAWHHTPTNAIGPDENPEQSFCEWNIKGYAESFTAGTETWSELGSSVNLVNFGHWANSASNTFPALMVEQLRLRFASGGEPQFIYREGQLYLSDLALVRRTATDVDLGTWDADEPIRFRLTVQRDTASADVIWGNDENNGVANLYLSLVGITVWELP